MEAQENTAPNAPPVWEEMSVADLPYKIRCSPGGGQLPLSVALADLRERLPGHAYGRGSHPGLALHAALCAAAGVRPDTHGIYSGMAAATGMGRVAYQNKLLDRFEPLRGVRQICARLGLVLVCLPDGGYVVHGTATWSTAQTQASG